MQLPVPPHIDEYKVCNAVCPQKDVDGFNEVNIGRLCLDVGHLIPCTPLGVYELLRRYKIDTFGKNAVVVGRSKHIGMPMAMLLHTDGKLGHLGLDATVTICHRYTPPEELKKHCLQADIIVVATGIPHLIKADMVKPGACVIDVGITRIKDPEGGKDKLVGDVDFESKFPSEDIRFLFEIFSLESITYPILCTFKMIFISYLQTLKKWRALLRQSPVVLVQ